ncbi:MAG: DUF2849 domain-containing protein [Granulosicoccus sp.]
MSSHDLKNIDKGAILLASDLRTGLTVYLRRDSSWSSNAREAWVVTNDAEADKAKTLGANSESANEVMEPYLVDTTETGDPTHIREHLRTTGPSVDYLATGL